MNKNKLKNKIAEMNNIQLREEKMLISKELFNLRFQKALGDLKNTSRFSILKKDIARIETEFSRRLLKGDKL